MTTGFTFVIIGILGGVAAGFFGVGGGIVIVPALIYGAGFTQHKATGTSLAVLLPPIGLAAAIEYYRHGNVDVRAAIILAITMFLTRPSSDLRDLRLLPGGLPGPWRREAPGLDVRGYAALTASSTVHPNRKRKPAYPRRASL